MVADSELSRLLFSCIKINGILDACKHLLCSSMLIFHKSYAPDHTPLDCTLLQMPKECWTSPGASETAKN